MSDQINSPKGRGSGWFAGGGILTGVLALLGASCCVLPIILVSLGVSSAAVGNLAFFASAKPWFMGATILLIAAAVYFAFRSGRRPGLGFWIAMVIALCLLSTAYILPSYEREILEWMDLR